MDRILIVDDEFLIRYTLEEGLKDRGYDAYSAATVEEGLEFVRKYHPGVLLLDNLLENSVGMDEIVNFKNADEELQVIMMTAYGSVSQAVEATKRGAYDYILKPFDVDEIDMLIKRCLEQKRNRDSLVFLKGDVPQFLGAVSYTHLSLKAVGMTMYRKQSPNHLSGGQKQRVAIAGVMAMKPECIVLDEPTAMLDPNGRKEVIRTVHELNRAEGITMVLITHYMEEVVDADPVSYTHLAHLRATTKALIIL